MSVSRKKQGNVITYGVILALLSGLCYYFFVEQNVVESRLTYSVSADTYSNYLDLPNKIVEADKGEAFLSANYESISDTLIAKGVRRFELKKYTKGVVSDEQLNTIYFESMNQLPIPILIKELSFGESKPIGRTVAISLLILILSLIIELIGRKASSNRIKESTSK